MNIRSIAIYSDADFNTPHTCLADEAYPLHDNAAKDTYTNIDKILSIAELAKA
jgi:acetyl/propionyl-CoA carboxylase alpha subunit